MATTDNDPFRRWMSGFGSGLEHLWDALRHEYDSKTKKSVLALSFRCLVLQTVLNFITYLVPNSICITFNQLFYPTVLFFRYLDPDPWDHLFMGTVRSLGCAERSDIVTQPGPRYFVQLKQYIRRTFKAYFAIGIIHQLVHRTGVFSLPSIGLGLIAVHQFLRHKGVNRAFLKLCVIVIFIGPRWPVWAVQTFALQQLFMYELLQPYLARVQFKGWEEQAWLSQHEIELQGFAFGAWLLCSVPWFGVAAIPFMFPAVAFLLTRSCGLMESSGQGVSGDVIEKRSPGVKAVAMGISKSVEGDWETAKVKTHVRNTKVEVYSPKSHDKTDAAHYICDRGVQTGLTEEQIAGETELSKQRKQELYRAEASMHPNHLPEESSIPSRPVMPFIPNWGSPMPHIPFGRPDLLFSASSSSSSSTPAPTTTSANNEQAESTRSEREQESLTKYNFSDRKTDETAPSAPPSGILDDRSWADSEHGENAFRVESATTPDERSTGQEEKRPAIKVKAQENHIRAQERRSRPQGDSIRAEEERSRAKEQRARAEEQRARAAEQRMHAEEMRRGKHRRDTQPTRNSRRGMTDAFHPNRAEEEEEEEAEEAWEEEYESNEDTERNQNVGDWGEYAGKWLENMQYWRGRGGGFGRGWDHGRGRGDPRHMGRWPPRGPRGARGSRGDHGSRGRHNRSESQRDVEDESPARDDSANRSSTRPPGFSRNGLSAAIAENMLNVEEHINQRMENWGRQWAQKLNEAMPKPSNGPSGL
ncbi:hypothetical protein CPC16_009484 [Podila verticillata]|nr:hypothetical protein CPC16_009484 [Podila verticillata]